MLEGQPSGVLLGTVTAKDPDEGENGTVFYSLSGERDTLASLLGMRCEVSHKTYWLCLFAFLNWFLVVHIVHIKAYIIRSMETWLL